MILALVIFILILGGILCLATVRGSEILCRWIALISVGIDLVLVVFYWISNYKNIILLEPGSWLLDFKKEWIPQWGISFHLALDGLSLILVVLTLFLGVISILVSWQQIKERVRFFHFNILWILAGLLGVFLAMDLFLFYFFWEMMLIPMFFIINIWGYENRHYAATKFFLFTQGSGLLMLLAILGLYFLHGNTSGIYTFDYFELIGSQLSPKTSFWLMCGFLIAFAVKLPAIPFHTWLPDAHTEAPTAGSIILAGLLLKTGAYGMLRFVLPLFPEAAHQIAPYAVTVGVIGILYGAKMAYAQTNLKRLIAFTSVSHMGFIVLGIFSFQVLAYQGVVLQIVAHGITTGALFMIAGSIKERVHSLDMDKMSGFWQQMPRMGGFTLVFVLASLGLPGLGNFIAEFLVLSSAFQTHMTASIFASLGLITSVIYSLKILQKVFHGKPIEQYKLTDFSIRENIIMAALALTIVGLGFFPQSIIHTVKVPIEVSKHSIKNENQTSELTKNKIHKKSTIKWINLK
jgi:NADH-quinone oxidoreductase subunit M